MISNEIKIKEKDLEITFYAQNDKGFEMGEMTVEKLMPAILKNPEAVSFLDIEDSSNKINTDLLGLVIETAGSYLNKVKDFYVLIVDDEGNRNIGEIKYGNAIFGEVLEDGEDFEWSCEIAKIPFLDSKLLKEYKFVKKIQELIKSDWESEIKITETKKKISSLTEAQNFANGYNKVSSSDRIEILSGDAVVTITPDYKMVEKYGYVKALIFNDLDMKVDFPEKLELSDEYAIFDEKTSTLIGHDEEYWKYKNIEFYLGDETVEFDVENLEKFKNVVQEDIDNLENLVRKMINIVVPKDAKKLQRFARTFIEEWKNLEKNAETKEIKSFKKTKAKLNEIFGN